MSVSDRVADAIESHQTTIAPFVEDGRSPDDDLTYEDAAEVAHAIAEECASLADEVMTNPSLPNDALTPLEDVAHYMHQVALAFETATDAPPADAELDPAYEGAVNGLEEAADQLGLDGVLATVEE